MRNHTADNWRAVPIGRDNKLHGPRPSGLDMSTASKAARINPRIRPDARFHPESKQAARNAAFRARLRTPRDMKEAEALRKWYEFVSIGGGR